MSEPATIEMNPSDALGVVQRGLHELQVYFNAREAMQVDVPASLAHLERLIPFLEQLQRMQGAILAANQNGAEARAN